MSVDTRDWPGLDETIEVDCSLCADMGRRLVCRDDGSWAVEDCDCRRGNGMCKNFYVRDILNWADCETPAEISEMGYKIQYARIGNDVVYRWRRGLEKGDAKPNYQTALDDTRGTEVDEAPAWN